MTEIERAHRLSRQIDRLLSAGQIERDPKQAEDPDLQLIENLAQIGYSQNRRFRDTLQHRLASRVQQENPFGLPTYTFFNHLKRNILSRVTQWVVPALVVFILIIYPIRRMDLHPQASHEYRIPPAVLQVVTAPAAIPITESSLTLRLPDPIPTPLAGSVHFISTSSPERNFKTGLYGLQNATNPHQTPKPAPLATDIILP